MANRKNGRRSRRAAIVTQRVETIRTAANLPVVAVPLGARIGIPRAKALRQVVLRPSGLRLSVPAVISRPVQSVPVRGVLGDASLVARYKAAFAASVSSSRDAERPKDRVRDTCKKRPDGKRRASGSGASRPFVPWC